MDFEMIYILLKLSGIIILHKTENTRVFHNKHF
jgi:hypothetical protein